MELSLADIDTDILKRHEQAFAHVFVIYIPVGLHKHMLAHSQCADVYRSKLYAHNINAT